MEFRVITKYTVHLYLQFNSNIFYTATGENIDNIYIKPFFKSYEIVL